MPELPEVETTLRGIAPYVTGRRIGAVVVREPRLRWPVPKDLARSCRGQVVESVSRRGKYLLFRTAAGTLIVHLGMSGSLRLVDAGTPPGPHDHADIALEGGRALRLRDPRRFGAVLWTVEDPLRHPLLRNLGPEPLDDAAFTGDYLYQRSRGRRQAVKTFIMDSRIVVGVGNIYANEALFSAGIRPTTAAGRIGRTRCRRLAEAIARVLRDAIAAGGTTLRDFINGDGKPGYFARRLQVYGRAGEACRACGHTIRSSRLGQRSTFYCPHCQR
ncbi:MAG: bifunctional DNA-formamidopyrimidine glycosylase/DNA-(apurinic or apyrimidinic site) lyase [Gammaproteobacteria bacterium]